MKRLFICIISCCCSLLLMATTDRNAISAFKLLDISDRQITNTEYTSTSECPLDNMSAICGLSISGHSQLNSDTSLVRVLLIDNQGKSYLVYEDFYLTASNLAFQDMAFETAYLDTVIPDKLKIIIRDATLHLNDVSYSYGNEVATRSSGLDRKTLAKMHQQTQEEYMIDRWNEYNEANNGYWFAGKTALSGLSYETKKALLGATSDAYQSDGLEYYVGGIYVMRSYEDDEVDNQIIDDSKRVIYPPVSYTSYVESFDWRNRHGRNWITSIKNQKEPNNNVYGNNGCWAFATCATLESRLNLQFNQLLDYDLSEQELGSCSSGSLQIGGYGDDALSYIRKSGIVTEECMPFQNNEFIPCSEKCDNPLDKLTIDSHETIVSEVDTLKHYLINNGPLYGEVKNAYLYHAMCLCGYGVVHVGDYVEYLNKESGVTNKLVIEEGDSLIGQTYWIYKNSYGINPNVGSDGYFYVIFEDPSFQHTHLNINSNIHSQAYDSTDVVCEDRDGDGYYFWGLGEKPSHCPSCAPDTPDGNDSNPDLTVMNEYGQFLPMLTFTKEIISTDTTWNINDTLCGDVYIQNYATLTINNASITLHPLSHILVEEGATLIVDNSTIINAEIIVQDGGSLIIRNSGIIQQGKDDQVDIQLGGTLEMESGEIRIFE